MKQLIQTCFILQVKTLQSGILYFFVPKNEMRLEIWLNQNELFMWLKGGQLTELYLKTLLLWGKISSAEYLTANTLFNELQCITIALCCFQISLLDLKFPQCQRHQSMDIVIYLFFF